MSPHPICLAVFVIAWLPLACSGQEPRPAPPVDCLAVAEEYETLTLQDFEREEVQWFGVDDLTPGAEVGDETNTPTLEAIPQVREAGAQEAGRCGSTQAIVFRARGFTTWGAFFADWTTVQSNITNLEDWEGFTFWARTAPGSDRSFFLEIDNAHTALVDEDQPEADVNLCVEETKDENGNGTGRYPEGTDPAETCGNSYRAIVTTGEDWRFFTVAFDDLVQDRKKPNVRKGGFDPTVQLVRFRVKFPVETDIELWFDDLGLYRSW